MSYESIETDWKAIIASDDIDAIDICAPNNMHAEISIAAAEAGKMILCEKPLTRTLAEAKPMVDAVEKAGVKNMVWYNYRRIPAVTLAKQIIDLGKLGRILHYRSNFLQDWTINADLPQGGEALWRLDADAAGSCVTGDLLVHCIDTAMWLNGGIKDVSALTETCIKERVHQETGNVQKWLNVLKVLKQESLAHQALGMHWKLKKFVRQFWIQLQLKVGKILVLNGKKKFR